jgi:hypothetical protein
MGFMTAHFKGLDLPSGNRGLRSLSPLITQV